MIWAILLFSLVGWGVAYFYAAKNWDMEAREQWARREMKEAELMKETAESNHRYALHLLRVARDTLKEAKRERRGR